jgi:hypothetical protein
MNNFALQFTLNRRHLKSDRMFVCTLVPHLGSVSNTTSRVHNCNTTNPNNHLWSNIGTWTRPNPRRTHKREARKNTWICIWNQIYGWGNKESSVLDRTVYCMGLGSKALRDEVRREGELE